MVHWASLVSSTPTPAPCNRQNIPEEQLPLLASTNRLGKHQKSSKKKKKKGSAKATVFSSVLRGSRELGLLGIILRRLTISIYYLKTCLEPPGIVFWFPLVVFRLLCRKVRGEWRGCARDSDEFWLSPQRGCGSLHRPPCCCTGITGAKKKTNPQTSRLLPV